MHNSATIAADKATATAAATASSSEEKGKENDEMMQSMEKLKIEESSTSSSSFKRKPVVIIVVGMAGSGKTTFMRQLVYHTHVSKLRSYVINLDPAVLTLPFGANIDIRDTVQYKEVMKQFNLGPNGGILTSLNLFATMFDESTSPFVNQKTPPAIKDVTKCHLMVRDEFNEGNLVVVAEGRVHPMPEGVIHNSYSLPDHYRVSIDVPYEDHRMVDLPIPSPDGVKKLGEAKDYFVQWPQSLVIFANEGMSGGEIIEKKSTSQSKENVSNCDPLSLGPTCVDICNFISEEVNQNLTEECELLCYRMVGGDYGTVTVPLSSNYFFLKEKVDIWVTKTGVIEFLRGACANVSLIHVYIMFLIENYLFLFQISGIKFLCPQRICDAEIRRDFVAPSLYVKHEFMGEANKEQMTKFVLAPYLQENHWVLLVVDIKRGEAYEFDPLAVKPFKNRRWLNCNNVLSNSYKFYRASLKGPPLSKGRRELTFLPMECAQQTGGTECGYYVMRYMHV